MSSQSTWDDIIVGAGSSGAVLASRLSEESNRRVLLLEAGPDYSRVEDLPDAIRLAGAAVMSGYNWDFMANLRSSGMVQGLMQSAGMMAASPRDMLSTAKAALQAPQSLNTTMQQFPYCVGKMVGGSSSVNGAVALRGLKEDFDRWAALGCDDWEWSKVLPFFRKLETDHDFLGDAHGDAGPISVIRTPRHRLDSLEQAFWAACNSLGLTDLPDLNASSAVGVGALPNNITADGIRVSTAVAYLFSARTRENLRVQGNAYVERILFDGKCATGVEVIIDGRKELITAGRVTICAGAINTPAILLRSGIGDRDRCEALSVGSVAHLPGVGENLMDHSSVMLWMTPQSTAGKETNGRHQVMARTRSQSAQQPDLNLTVLSRFSTAAIPMLNDLLRTPLANALSVVLTAPASKGRVYLKDAMSKHQPVIDLNLGSAPEDIDRLMEGVRLAWQIAKSEPFASHNKSVFLWNDAMIKNDGLLRSAIQRFLNATWHPVGTAKMGHVNDSMAVVDSQCRVNGIDRLRVIDASVMPYIPGAPTNLTCIMMAERIAEWMAI